MRSPVNDPEAKHYQPRSARLRNLGESEEITREMGATRSGLKPPRAMRPKVARCEPHGPTSQPWAEGAIHLGPEDPGAIGLYPGSLAQLQ